VRVPVPVRRGGSSLGARCLATMARPRRDRPLDNATRPAGKEPQKIEGGSWSPCHTPPCAGRETRGDVAWPGAPGTDFDHTFRSCLLGNDIPVCRNPVAPATQTRADTRPGVVSRARGAGISLGGGRARTCRDETRMQSGRRRALSLSAGSQRMRTSHGPRATLSWRARQGAAAEQYLNSGGVTLAAGTPQPTAL